MTREQPSLETLWLQNIETIEKVQRTGRSNTAPSSKTFRDEANMGIALFVGLSLGITSHVLVTHQAPSYAKDDN
jgi:hypothetical protein